MEGEICNLIFADENVLQFNIRVKSADRLGLKIFDNGSPVNKGLILERLAGIGLDDIEIEHSGEPDVYYKNKFQYVYSA
jgi:hypothetical protein